MRYVLKATTDTQATKRLKDWLKRYQFHTSAVVSKIAKTVIVREKAMIDTINSPFSNGIMEGTNNKIKLIKRRGFGYRNDAHLFLRLRLENRSLILSSPDFGDEPFTCEIKKSLSFLIEGSSSLVQKFSSTLKFHKDPVFV